MSCGTDDREQASGHLAQQLVTHVVTEAVVDLLETVEVEQQQGQRLAGLQGVGQLVGGLLQEQLAVGQPGEGVVQRLVVALERDRGRGVDGDQRQSQQRHERGAVVDDDDDDRCQAEQRRAGSGAVRQAVPHLRAQRQPDT